MSKTFAKQPVAVALKYGGLVLLFVAMGCTRHQYRHSADDESETILYQKTLETPWELPFIDSNVLFGDGHVITRTTLESYYAYAGSTIFPY